jgi:glyoxylase-like metal-dependent hydrolase (beta-lactamase superfamily II)
VTTTDTRYEAYALRYGTRSSMRSKEFYRYDLMDAPDAPQQMDYYFWLLRNASRTVLVDCGFDAVRGKIRQREQKVTPVELLGRLGVRPGDVDHVVISHLHYDHVGNIGLFPKATVSIARKEYDFWTGPLGDRPLMKALVIPEELRMVRQLAAESRLKFVDVSAEVLPGIFVTTVGGHTPGQVIVEVEVASGRLILASDSLHYYEQLDRDWPFRLFANVEDSLNSFELLRDFQKRPGTAIVAGHDPRVGEYFSSVMPDCLDLSAGPLFDTDHFI